ncbi:hypothetical protein N9N54_07540 [Planktomarina temperata]|nr:hypothetical protein [Planktomarina temperata]
MTIQQHASFDSSAAELNATSKLVKAWESKNAKNAAKAGGVSLMALSLAACGGSSTPVVVEDAAAVADPVVPVVDAAKKFYLTSKVDQEADFTGGSGDDIFYADNTGTEGGSVIATISVADSINGGLGDDVLNVYSAGAAFGVATLTSIETVNVYDQDADLDISSASFDSATTINLVRGDSLALTLGDNVATVGLTDIKAGVVSGGTDDLVVNFDAKLTAATLNISGLDELASSGDEILHVNGAKITDLTVNVNGASEVDAIDADAATSITINADAKFVLNGTDDSGAANGIATSGADASIIVTGSGAVTLGSIDNDVDSLVATSNTGGVTATAAADNKDAIYTLSAGKDVFTTDDDGFAAADKFAVDAGAGSADVLVVAAAADVNTAAEANRYSNFEVIRTAETIDMSLVAGITSLEITGGTSKSYTEMTAAQAKNITFTADNATSTIFGLFDDTGTSDEIVINLSNTTATADIDLTGVSVDNFEKVTFNSVSGTNTTTDNSVKFLANKADEVSEIVFTGGADTTLTVISDTLDVVAVDIDASAMTGTADFTLVQTASLVTGSSVKGTDNGDTIALGATLGSTFDGGAGDDGFSTAIATLASDGVDDTVVKGGLGSDTLTIINGTTAITDTYFSNVTGMEKLIVNAGTNASGGFSLTTGGSFKTAYTDGVTLTTTGSTIDDTEVLTIAAGLYDKGVTATIVHAGVGDDLAEDIQITTGAGDDTITLTAASWVGSGDGSGILIKTGDGADTFTLDIGDLHTDASGGSGDVTTYAVEINMGAGADTLDLGTKSNGDESGAIVAITVDAGDSTTTAWDVITNFDLGVTGTSGDYSDALVFTGSSTVETDFSSSTDYGVIKSHTVTTGIVKFDDASSYGTELIIDSSNLADVIGYLAANTATEDVATFAFDKDGDGVNDGTMVYHNGTTDSLVELVGVIATKTDATNTDDTGLLFII